MNRYGFKKWIGAAFLAGGLLLGGCGKEETSYLDRGLGAVTEQQYSSALEFFTQAVINGEDSEEVYRGIGLAYMGLKDYEKAVDSFSQALSYAPMFPGDLEYDINYYMAIACYKLGEYDDAISCYDAIIAMRPKETEAYFLRGSMRLYINDVEGAALDFEEAVNQNPKDFSMYIDIYDRLLRAGQESLAQGYLDKVMTNGGSGISDYDKGRISYYQKDYQQACNYFERCRANGEVDNKVISLLGECYRLEGRYDYASAVYAGYVESNPDPEIYNQLGLCYMEQKSYEEALTAFEGGIAITENNTCMQTLKKNRIACYEYMYDFSSALTYLEQYIDDYGSDPLLEKEYAFLSTR